MVAKHESQAPKTPRQTSDTTLATGETRTNIDKPDHNECMYGSAIVDTGASTSLLTNDFGRFLCRTEASTACIQGFEGKSEIKGNVRGTGHMYILGAGEGSTGFQLSTNFDTIDGLNSNIFSVSSLYEDHNFSIMLRSKTNNNGRCELVRTTTEGARHSIPIIYDKTRSAFMIRFVIGKDKSKVLNCGKEIVRRMGLSLVENMRLGEQSSLCPSKITNMGVIMYAPIKTQGIVWGSTPDISKPRGIDTIINRAETYIPMHFKWEGRQNAMTAGPSNTCPEPEMGAMEPNDDASIKPPHEPTQEEWNDYIFKETDGIVLGAKAGMKSREKRMTKLELHMRHGHIGSHDGKCIVCNLLRGSFRKIFSKTSPYIEQRVGHTFCGDVITWSDRSRKGSKYTMVLRDICSGYFFLIHAIFRNEFTRRIETLVINARKNPLFMNLKRPIISTIKLDPAGEWRDDNKNFQEMASRIGLNVIYSSPNDKRSHAHGENSVKQIELTARSILLNRALPTSFIEDACDQAACIRNYYPLVRDCVSTDGDARRPLERITVGG